VPVALLVPAGLGLAFLVLPLAGLLIRAPWTTLPQRLAEPGILTALRLSLLSSTIATLVCMVLGVPLARLLAWVEFPGRRFVRALVTVPLVLPPVVGGIALLLVFGRRGIIGWWLDSTFGITLPFTTAGVVPAEAFVAMPFLVIAVEGALRGADARYEEAAATLGAGRWTTFTHVTLPLVAPGIAAGGVAGAENDVRPGHGGFDGYDEVLCRGATPKLVVSLAADGRECLVVLLRLVYACRAGSCGLCWCGLALRPVVAHPVGAFGIAAEDLLEFARTHRG
jgi:molybdate transport system permease protein